MGIDGNVVGNVGNVVGNVGNVGDVGNFVGDFGNVVGIVVGRKEVLLGDDDTVVSLMVEVGRDAEEDPLALGDVVDRSVGDADE